MKLTQQISPPIFLFFLIFIILHPQLVQASVLLSLSRCAEVLIPSLFPFIFLSNCFAKFDFSTLSAAIRPFCSKLSIQEKYLPCIVLGWLGGFPVGANMINQKAKNNELIDLATSMSSCAGIGFLLGSVGGAFLRDYTYATFLYLTQILITLFFSTLLLNQKSAPAPPPKSTEEQNTISISGVIEAIKNSLFTILNICAFTIVFSVLSDILAELVPFRWGSIFFRCFFEFSTGVYMSLELPSKLMHSAIGFAIGFGGLCVHAQIYSLTERKIKNYYKIFCVKLFTGVLCAVVSLGYTILGIRFFLLFDIFLVFLLFFLIKIKKVWTINSQNSIISKKGGEYYREKKKTGY